MSFKEQLINDWTGRTVVYQGEKILIVKEIEYEGVKYLYGAVDDTIMSDGPIDVCFLYKVKDDVFAYVKDEKLYNLLLAKVTGVFMGEELKKIARNLKNN